VERILKKIKTGLQGEKEKEKTLRLPVRAGKKSLSNWQFGLKNSKDSGMRTPRPLSKLVFWLGQLPKGKYLQKRCLNEEISSWLVDALCVFKRKNRLITFSFIVSVSPGFGIYLSPY